MNKSFHSISMIAVVMLVLGGCDSGSGVNQTSPTTTAQPVQAEEAVDESRYIRAAELLDLMRSDSPHRIFDVRSRASYAESHIEGALSMPYGQVEASDVAAIDGVTPTSSLVTYCGCPHHLAGLAADKLTQWGYSNVRVLYEGYWYWHDNNMPLARHGTAQTTQLYFAGKILRDGEPVAGQQVFIRNRRNDQLEAAVSDDQGRFDTAFHIFDFDPGDTFDFSVSDVSAPIIHSANARFDETNAVELRL